MQWITLFALPVVVTICWLYTVSATRSRFPRLHNKRICLLIAHPDDEAMFFAPTVLALTDPSLGNHVKILCLSSGDADGLGETRKKELVKSGLTLGLRQEDDVFVVDSPDFPDSMTTTWEKAKVSHLLSSAFAPALAKNPSSRGPATATIDVLITFDAGGVSAHPNHISLYHGAVHFISSLLPTSPVDLYTLTSVSVLRKYTSIFDTLTSLVSMAVSGKKKGKDGKDHLLLFLSGYEDVRKAQRAMTTAHISQMRWFRWGWIGLSRYMVVNDLKLDKPR